MGSKSSPSPQLLAVLKAFEDNGAHVTGGPDNFSTSCPCHDDTAPSLSINDGDSGVRLKCHAGCAQSELFLAVVEYTGLPKTEFFYQKLSKSPSGPPVTVAELAAAKKLPLDLFSWAKIEDSPQGILIPYWDENGKASRTRIRRALAAVEGSLWKAASVEGQEITAYGAWRLPEFRPDGTLYFVEGETDTLTGWSYDLPVLGFPGKGTARKILAENPKLVSGIKNIFVIEESDDFVKREFLWQVRRGLSDAGWEGQVFPMRLPVKDLSDLHLERGAEGFLPALMEVWETAVDAPNWPEPLPILLAAVQVCALITAPDFPAVFKVRNIQRRMRKLSSAQIRLTLEQLEKANIVRRLAAPRAAGRPREEFRRNPKATL